MHPGCSLSFPTPLVSRSWNVTRSPTSRRLPRKPWPTRWMKSVSARKSSHAWPRRWLPGRAARQQNRNCRALEGDALSSPDPRRRQSVALHYGACHGGRSTRLVKANPLPASPTPGNLITREQVLLEDEIHIGGRRSVVAGDRGERQGLAMTAHRPSSAIWCSFRPFTGLPFVGPPNPSVKTLGYSQERRMTCRC